MSLSKAGATKPGSVLGILLLFNIALTLLHTFTHTYLKSLLFMSYFPLIDYVEIEDSRDDALRLFVSPLPL